MGLVQRPPEVRVGVLFKGVEVRPHGAGEEKRVLGNDGDVPSNLI